MALKRRPYSCGLEAALDILDGKWKALILRGLRDGPRRFGELRRAVAGVSEKMLIQSLKELEADGAVVRRDFREIPPRVEYSLTRFGATLFESLIPLCEWGTRHMTRIEALETRGRSRLSATV
ncbi:MAG: winged helix-turn-helix transcriptional regulator [Gemmatimonadaceae bacterium]